MPDQETRWRGTEDPSQPSADKNGPSEERTPSSAVLRTEPLLATGQDPTMIGTYCPTVQQAYTMPGAFVTMSSTFADSF